MNDHWQIISWNGSDKLESGNGMFKSYPLQCDHCQHMANLSCKVDSIHAQPISATHNMAFIMTYGLGDDIKLPAIIKCPKCQTTYGRFMGPAYSVPDNAHVQSKLVTRINVEFKP